MVDWWMTNRKRLPKAISSFANWLSNTRPDESLRAERLRKLDREEADAKFQKLMSTPRASAELLEKLRQNKGRLFNGQTTKTT